MSSYRLLTYLLYIRKPLAICQLANLVKFIEDNVLIEKTNDFAVNNIGYLPPQQL